MFDWRCDNCGKEWEQLIGHGDTHPECCGFQAEKFFNGKAPGVIQDSIEGGMTLENVGHEPVTVYSHSEHRRILKERGLINRVQHTPVPGSDQSPHTTDWSRGADKTFLTNAQELLEHTRPTAGKADVDSEGISIESRTRDAEEPLPPRWESEYRGGPGKVVK